MTSLYLSSTLKTTLTSLWTDHTFACSTRHNTDMYSQYMFTEGVPVGDLQGFVKFEAVQ